MRVADGTLHLEAEPDAAPRARRWVADALRQSPHAALVPDAELVVSELVTNALLHAGPPVAVRVDLGDAVRIEVSDGSRVAPVRARARADAMTGRGLSLVAALARDWGIEPRPYGKAIWCELAPVGAPLSEPDGEVDVDALLATWDDDFGIEPAGARHTVSLGDVPTDLLLAAKAHVDNLVREFTLAAHGAESGRTAAIPAQLAELFDAVVTRFAEARQSIKRQAIDAATRGAERTTLTLTLPLDAADAGERYLEALDEIDNYARAARLLTLETPPQHRVFRRWYVESLVAQLRAVAAGEAPPPVPSFERRLLQEVAAVEVARRASDRAARLQAVTAALAGTTTVEDVGRVVLSEGIAALGAFGGGLVMLDRGDHLRVPATVGYEPGLVERISAESRDDDLPAVVTLRTGKPVWLESREERDERFPGLTGLEPGTISLCAVPLRAGDRVLGALRLSFDVARLFDADERRFILTLAGQTAQALERAEAVAATRSANDKLEFLADASAALAASDYRDALRDVARLAVPRVADWCVIHLVEDGAIAALAVAYADPEQAALAEALQRHHVEPGAPHGVARIVRTGAAELHTEVADELLVSVARDDEHLAALRALGVTSALLVPLAAHGRVFGALSMLSAESERVYDEADLRMATDLARRAALAIDIANLRRELGGDA